MAYKVSSPNLVDSAPNNFTACCRPPVVPVDKLITRVFQNTNYHFQENNVLCASFTLLFQLSFTLIRTNWDGESSGYAEDPDNRIFL